MLYYLIHYLEAQYHPPGFQAIEFITVRAALAAITALGIALIAGPRVIEALKQKQMREHVGLSSGSVDHSHKAGTPTMGGVIILLAILTATLLWAPVLEVYVWLSMLALAWMGAVGFVDDWIKVVKKDLGGVAPRVKVCGQLGLGLVVGSTLYFHDEFANVRGITDLPFLYDRSFDYDIVGRLVGTEADLGWLLFLPVVAFIVTATSNAVNLTDGLDGLAGGVTAIVSLGLVALSYIAGHVELAGYIGVTYLPGAGELAVVATAMAAACLGFLWFNTYPAAVFMGDTGALALGAVVGTLALMVKKELLLPLLCLVFFMETVSVILQTTWFRYTRKKTGTGRRIFRMAPLHHHFEAKGIHEVTIVNRFWIVTVVTVLSALLVLRIQ